MTQDSSTQETNNTEINVQKDKRRFKAADDGFTCRIAHNADEAINLIEACFEYVTSEYSDDGKIFRKRK